MATATAVRYVLAVHDVGRSSKWYQDVLGFEEVFALGDDWRFLKFGACFLMLGQCPDALPATDLGDHSYFAYWDVDDAQALYDKWKSTGVEMVKQIKDEPWGQREFGFHTTDGHRVMVGQRIN
ncbi:MAG TPA: VOC family protein [Fimbriimonadaceae bacterium]|nr:VOC family protein [Fimbriimonadaceae bacterium]